MPSLSLTLRPSLVLSLSVIFIHALAIVSLALITAPAWIKAAASVACLVIGIRLTARYALLKTDGAIVKIMAFNATNPCKIKTRGGAEYGVRLKSADLQFDYIALLVFGTNKRTFKAVITKDAVDPEEFYTLRLYLRSFERLKSSSKTNSMRL